jgi:hypothetical protein
MGNVQKNSENISPYQLNLCQNNYPLWLMDIFQGDNGVILQLIHEDAGLHNPEIKIALLFPMLGI